MRVEQLPYGERVFFLYIQSDPIEQKYTGWVRPMCKEETQSFRSREELFDKVVTYLENLISEPQEEQILNLKDGQAHPMQKGIRFYVVEVYFSQKNSLQGFIRGKEYPQRTAFRNKEEFCRLLIGHEFKARKNRYKKKKICLEGVE